MPQNVRQLPAPADGQGRVESGAVQFGDEWLRETGYDTPPPFLSWENVKSLSKDIDGDVIVQ